jgi:hypothetical protein
MCDNPGEYIKGRKGSVFKDGLAKQYQCGIEVVENETFIAEIACARHAKSKGWIW